MATKRKRTAVGLGACALLAGYVWYYVGGFTLTNPLVTVRQFPAAWVARGFIPAAWLESKFTGRTILLNVATSGIPPRSVYVAGPLVELGNVREAKPSE